MLMLDILDLLQRKARGQELLDMICQSMNLLEKDYFGLIYEDRHDSRNWLDLYKRIIKFIKSMKTQTKKIIIDIMIDNNMWEYFL